jgi:lysophospholipase L1-like esterase
LEQRIVSHRAIVRRITNVSSDAANWVFLGDSLTEGIGTHRDNYVSELAKLLRAEDYVGAVHTLRLREVDPATFNRFIPTNLAGYLESDTPSDGEVLWLWNLASEGRFIDDDRRWVPLLRNLAPQRIFIYRGSLESIIRPAALHDGHWPVWMPSSWRGLASMDPRCYFSRTAARHFKQTTIDSLKQMTRLRLLADRPGRPLYDGDVIQSHYEALIDALPRAGAHIHMLGLIPPDERCFPGSGSHFSAINARLRTVAASRNVEFIDWARDVQRLAAPTAWRCRDGFHPNAEGASLLARILHDRIATQPLH